MSSVSSMCKVGPFDVCMRCHSASDRSLCRACTESVLDRPFPNDVNKLLWGLQVLKAHGKVEISVGHEEFFAGTGGKLPEHDHEVLTDLGWRWDEEYECYAMFV